MAGMLAGAAERSFQKTVSNGVSQAIGKPIEGLTGQTRPPGHSEINWVNFNYPPLIRLIHYDINELPSTLTGIVRCFNISFQLTTIICLINVLDTFVVVLSTQAPKRWLIQSALHVLILPVASLATFYSGYRGIAGPEANLAFWFKIFQPMLGLSYLLLGLVPWGCINGLAQLSSMSDHTEGSVYWTATIIVESTLWLSNCLLAAVNTWRMHQADLFAGGSGGGALNSRF